LITPEDPERILHDILAGIPPKVQPEVIGDRAMPFVPAILQAQPGDGVLIAGKGHEDYQILGTEKSTSDDEQAQAALSERPSELIVKRNIFPTPYSPAPLSPRMDVSMI